MIVGKFLVVMEGGTLTRIIVLIYFSLVRLLRYQTPTLIVIISTTNKTCNFNASIINPIIRSNIYGGSGTGIVESLSVNPECMLQECAVEYDYYSNFTGDLVCYQRDNDSGTIPGSISYLPSLLSS